MVSNYKAITRQDWHHAVLMFLRNDLPRLGMSSGEFEEPFRHFLLEVYRRRQDADVRPHRGVIQPNVMRQAASN
jgi:hypothetical protein